MMEAWDDPCGGSLPIMPFSLHRWITDWLGNALAGADSSQRLVGPESECA